jgi:hypothetical protein
MAFGMVEARILPLDVVAASRVLLSKRAKALSQPRCLHVTRFRMHARFSAYTRSSEYFFNTPHVDHFPRAIPPILMLVSAALCFSLAMRQFRICLKPAIDIDRLTQPQAKFGFYASIQPSAKTGAFASRSNIFA